MWAWRLSAVLWGSQFSNAQATPGNETSIGVDLSRVHVTLKAQQQRRTSVAGDRCAGAACMLFLDGVYVDGANGSSTRFR